MTTNQLTTAERAAARAGIIARQLQQIAPGAVRVHYAPYWVTVGDRSVMRRWADLTTETGESVGISDALKDRAAVRAAARAAVDLLQHLMPEADWERALEYDVAASVLLPSVAPAELLWREVAATLPEAEDDGLPDLISVARPFRIDSERAA